MKNVKLICLIGEDDYAFIPHMVTYYRSIGIPTENFIIAIHAQTFASASNMLERFAQEHITPRFVWTGPWHNPKQEDLLDKKLWIFNHLIQNYTHQNDWIIPTDADEQHQYPTDIQNLINSDSFDYLIGYWIDRIARSGYLVEMLEQETLSEQFPIGTVISKEMFKKRRKSIRKVILCRNTVQFTNGGFHNVRSKNWRRYKHVGFVHHYKWNAKVVMKMKRRADSWYATDGLNEAILFMEHIKQNGPRIDWEQLGWCYDFEHSTYQVNILDENALRNQKPNTSTWEKISWIKSFMYENAVNPYLEPMLWNTFSFFWYMQHNFDKLKDAVVFEYGSGGSTSFWSNTCKQVVSVEYDEQWFRALQVQTKDISNVKLIYKPLSIDGEFARSVHEEETDFDVIVIDGRDRVNCAKQAHTQLSPRGVLIFDDTEREKYQSGIDFLLTQGFQKKDFVGLSPGDPNRNSTTSVFYRKENILGL